MPRQLPVVAAIPNYNMAASLRALLPQVLEQGYDGIYVLDDASTDSSREVVASFGSDIHFVAGAENVGAGANRNRILGALEQEAIIHFIDADVRLVSRRSPEAVRRVMGRPKTGAVGGLIQLPDGTPWMFNYGPRYSLFSMAGGWFQAMSYGSPHKLTAAFLNRISSWRHAGGGFPDIAQTPSAKRTYWVGEANFCIPSKIFKEVGGFDPALRYHEAQDLAFKLHARGYEVWFDPAIAVQHPYVDLADVRRKAIQSKAGRQIVHKHGLHVK